MQSKQAKFRTPEQVYQLWLKALRSGKYSQTKGTLHNSQGFCCLGVLCDLTVKDNGRGKWVGYLYNSKFVIDAEIVYHMPPDKIINYIGLQDEGFSIKLAGMNDSGKSFKQIADYIEHKVVPTALAAVKQGKLV